MKRAWSESEANERSWQTSRSKDRETGRHCYHPPAPAPLQPVPKVRRIDGRHRLSLSTYAWQCRWNWWNFNSRWNPLWWTNFSLKFPCNPSRNTCVWEISRENCVMMKIEQKWNLNSWLLFPGLNFHIVSLRNEGREVAGTRLWEHIVWSQNKDKISHLVY